MKISISNIITSSAAQVKGKAEYSDIFIKEFAFDTRKIVDSEAVLFLCLAKYPTEVLAHIKKAYGKGIRYFLVPEGIDVAYSDTLFIIVPDVIRAIQKIAINHRSNYSCPVIGITGSNGKTIIKEWLAQLLSHHKNVTKSPASYNSQLGVPLSVLQMNNNTEIGIFEAGISQPSEMVHLRPIIDCTIGILTNIGDAHDDGFENKTEKLKEKLRLFSHAEKLIFEDNSHEVETDYNLQLNQSLVHSYLTEINPDVQPEIICWSRKSGDCQYQVSIDKTSEASSIHISGKSEFTCRFLFTDQASLSNIVHVIICCIELGISNQEIQDYITLLEPVSMRLMLKKVSRNCLLVDDSYNADLTSLQNALDFAHEQKKHRSLHVIMTDFDQLKKNNYYYDKLSQTLEKYNVDKLSYIGQEGCLSTKNIDLSYFRTTEQLQGFLENNPPQNEIILLKGARKYRLDQLIGNFESQTHKTQLEISLDAIRTNIQYYRSISEPDTKIMTVIKASAYGSDSVPLAKHLIRCGVEYLAVAYFDEAIELRKEGIRAPIMIMNPDPSLVYLAEKHDLELEVYSNTQLSAILDASQKPLKLHLKIDSGMHRLGFTYEDLDKMVSLLSQHNDVEIISVFSHFSSAEDPKEDTFTKEQYLYYRKCGDFIKEELGLTSIMQHICNSTAATRFPEYHMNMIRIGIGLYGYGSENLQMAHRLTSYVAQIKTINKGDSVGYNRGFIADKKMTIATINIGYADGLSRKIGHGSFSFKVNNHKAPTVGNISMDTCAIDITNIQVSVGDEVVIYETKDDFYRLASISEQTPYEVISHTGPRVVRNYRRFD